MAVVEEAPAVAPVEDWTPSLLRLATSGSVDDGKSTLIGRLLFDSKQVLQDQLAHVEEVSERRGDGYVNLALLTDGLRAEREQGITIDVAYRYFQTAARKFVIADTPGHEQYTRNMVTGASTADLALVLVDARAGVLEQSKRHAFISSLLRIPHLVVCVNKMDLVDWSEEVYERIRDEFTDFAGGLEFLETSFIPVSALHGDNVVDRSAEMPWYQGPTLLHHLEHVEVASDRDFDHARFPVQWVIRPHPSERPDYRGYAGQVAGGVLAPGDELVALPSGRRTRIAAIDTFDGEVDQAFPPMSVTLLLEDDLDLGRGDMLCRPENAPEPVRELTADVCWMTDEPLTAGARYAIKHTTRSGPRGGRPRGAPRGRAHAGARARQGARAQRHRPGDPAPERAARGRSLCPQPHHRQLRPHRRGHQRHGGRGHDRGLEVRSQRRRGRRRLAGPRERSRAAGGGVDATGVAAAAADEPVDPQMERATCAASLDAALGRARGWGQGRRSCRCRAHAGHELSRRIVARARSRSTARTRPSNLPREGPPAASRSRTTAARAHRVRQLRGCGS